MLPDIVSSFAHKNVLVTGVTGFVGLALVEKLLRVVPDIGKIYLLVRPKYGKTVDDRLNVIKNNSIFETLNDLNRQSDLEKLIAVDGSVDKENIGLSEENLTLLIRDVNVVFHCAATLDFEANLKTTVEINLLGTRNIVELCKKMTQLQALVHVSSAYVNSDRESAEETIYPPPEEVNKVIELVRTLSDTHLEGITAQLLKKHPNTYTFTKNLAEHEVANEFSTVPSCIVRPSMIVGSWKEPVPGWTNSKNGPQGFFMGATMGVVRRLPVARKLIYDYIPVDVVVNTMIAGAVYTWNNKNQLEISPVFQCTSSTYNPFRWVDVEYLIMDLLHKYPVNQAVWYPHLKLLPSLAQFRMSSIIFHMIPAYVFDTISRLLGKRPKLVRLHTSVNQSLVRLEPFIFKQWKFDNSRCLELHNQLAPGDQETFGMDIGLLRWNTFFDRMTYGVRRFLFNEKDDTLPQAKRKHTILMFLNLIFLILLFLLLAFIFKTLLGVRLWVGVVAAVILFALIFRNL